MNNELIQIKSADPQFYQQQPGQMVGLTQSQRIEQQRLAVELLSHQRNASAEKFGRMVVLMAIAGVSGLVLLLGLAVFASAVRPAAPVTYNRCLIFCGGQ